MAINKTKEELDQQIKMVKKVANDICTTLHNSCNFHVLRYDTRFSIYIKIDGGICNSIRVSNHYSAREHLSYRYNILVDGLDNDYVVTDEKGYKRYYAKANSIHKIIPMIVEARAEKVKKYGRKNYKKYVNQQLNDNAKNSVGIWVKAKTVKSVSYDKRTKHTKIRYYNGTVVK